MGVGMGIFGIFWLWMLGPEGICHLLKYSAWIYLLEEQLASIVGSVFGFAHL